MKIFSAHIQNYRSIKELDLNFSERINVFVGANNVGKSNIFSALEWLVGPTYPTGNRLDKQDFYLGNEEEPMEVKLSFDDGNDLIFSSKWHDTKGVERHGLHQKCGLGFINDGERERYVSASVGTDRRINDNPAGNQWSLLGRMLKDFNKRLDIETTVLSDGSTGTKTEAFKERMVAIRNDVLFSIKDDDGTPLMSELKSIMQDEASKQLNCSPNDLSIDLNIYDPWNLFKTLQIFVQERALGMEFRASELGMGVQASLTIAILRAYSKLKLKNQTPIFIDEPELYLHPQARRRFYRVIEELADSGTQIFMTTHSTEFIDLAHFDSIYLVRRNSERGTYVRHADPKAFLADLNVRLPSVSTTQENLMLEYKNAFENTGDSQKAAEAIFASKVILVEGESESLILPYCFDAIGYDYIGKGISIVRCGGKNELDRFYRLYSEFGIPCYIIFDGDGQNKGTTDESHTIQANRGILSLFNVSADYPDGRIHEQYLGFIKRLEDALRIGPIGSNVKGLKLYRRFKEAIQSGAPIPAWPDLVAQAVDALPNEASSVLQAPLPPHPSDSGLDELDESYFEDISL